MIIDRKRLYSFLSLSCLAGYSWLGISHMITQSGNTKTVCIMKNLTGIPCPSCGSTRSVASIFKGNLQQAILLNPLGYVIFFALLILPVWIIMDLYRKNDSLWQFYQKAEITLRRKIIAIPLIILVIINWIWNIYKNV